MKTIFVLRLVCALLILSIGLLWLISPIFKYIFYKIFDKGYISKNLTLFQYLKDYYDLNWPSSIYNTQSSIQPPSITILVGFYLIFASVFSYKSALKGSKKILTEEQAASALTQYKSLLDSGAITEEEYSTKKAQLLK